MIPYSVISQHNQDIAANYVAGFVVLSLVILACSGTRSYYLFVVGLRYLALWIFIGFLTLNPIIPTIAIAGIWYYRNVYRKRSVR